MPVDIGSIKRNDLITGGAAVLALIFSLIPGAVSASVKDEYKDMVPAGVQTSEGWNLWHGIGVLAALLLLVGLAGVVAAVLNPPQVQALPVRWINVGVWGIVTLLVLIYILTYDADAPPNAEEAFNIGPGIVGWLLLLACLAAAVFSALGAQESTKEGSQTAGPAQPPPPPAA